MSEEHIFLTRSIGSAGMLGTRIGPGEALVRTDLSLRPSRRIGLFRMPIERGIWEGLVREVKGLDAAGGAPTGPLRPGTRTITIGLEDNGKNSHVRMVPANNVPEPLKPVLERISALTMQAMDHPERALEGAAAWTTAAVKPGEDLLLVLTLKNVGTEAVALVNPAAAKDSEAIGIELRLIRNVAQVEERDIKNLGVKRGEVVQMETSGKMRTAPSAVETLAPGAEVQYRVHKPAKIPPGDYKATLSVVSQAKDGGDATAVTGTIEIDLPNLRVSK